MSRFTGAILVIGSVAIVYVAAAPVAHAEFWKPIIAGIVGALVVFAERSSQR